jgi:hypothetical protein
LYCVFECIVTVKTLGNRGTGVHRNHFDRRRGRRRYIEMQRQRWIAMSHRDYFQRSIAPGRRDPPYQTASFIFP